MTGSPWMLVVEEDSAVRAEWSAALVQAGVQVRSAATGEQAMDALPELDRVDLAIISDAAPPLTGRELLPRLREAYPDLPVLMTSRDDSAAAALAAVREGANDFIIKPCPARAILERIETHLDIAPGDSADMVLEDATSRKLLALVDRVAASEVTVMLNGESGVGKEVFARYLHAHSPRRAAPFVAVNCAAIPENMLEAMLFGHERGAYTGAYEARAGKFEQAQGGSILLDEVSEMDLGLQGKLLRVLQEREVERLGGKRVLQLNVRVIATSNRDLRAEVEANRLREDLFYRLNVFPLLIPPLRERPGDVLPLARHFIRRHSRGLDIPGLSAEARGRLLNHPWPGNVRELDNVVQRALILRQSDVIEADDIRFEAVSGSRHPSVGTLAQAVYAGAAGAGTVAPTGQENRLGQHLRSREEQLIISALHAEHGRRKEVAARLGISPRTLRYKIARLREAGVAIPG